MARSSRSSGPHNGTGRRASIAAFLFALAAIGSRPAYGQSLPSNASREDIAVEQAHLLRTLADEHFLRENRSEAERLYREAGALLDTEVRSDRPFVRLLREELLYRLVLVGDPRMDFWGARFSFRPRAPVDPLVSLISRADEFERIALQVRERLTALQQNSTTATEAEIGVLRTESGGKVNELEILQAEYLSDYHAQRVEIARSRLLQIAQQTELLRQQQEQHQRSMDQVAQSLNSAVLSAVSKSAGLPVDLSAVANGQRLEVSLAQAATSLAGSSEFSAALRDVNAATANVVETYQRGREVATKLQQAANTVHDARELIRKPTFASLSQLGGLLYDQLDAPTRRQWERMVESAGPVIPLIEAARSRPALESAIGDYLRSKGALPAGVQTLEGLEGALGTYGEALRRRGEGELRGVYAGIMRELSNAEREAVLRGLVEYNVALAYAQRNPPPAPSNMVPSSPSLPAETTSPETTSPGTPTVPNDEEAEPYPRMEVPDPQTSATAVQGMFAGTAAAFFPQAALVQVGLQVMDGINQINELADKLNDIAEQMARYAVEEAHLRDQIDESARERVLANFERQIATQRASASRAELALWNSHLERQEIASNRLRQEVGFRMGLLFYQAEKLRQDFDELDYVLGFWTGPMESRHGNIQRELVRDPTNRRLALDRDIQLYSWLDEARAIESRRDDLDQLTTHWVRVATVAKDVARRLGIGPTGGITGRLGESGGGPHGTSLRELVSEQEWAQFETWKRLRGRTAPGAPIRPFVFSVFLGPYGLPGSEAIAPPQHGLRVVTVRMGVVQPGSELPQTSQYVRVGHPGIAYVPAFDSATRQFRFMRELYEPITHLVSAPNPAADLMDGPNGFRNRWRRDYAPYEFEGYGLYTTWSVHLDATQQNFRVSDIRMKFIYQFAPAQTDAQLLADMIETFGSPGAFPLRIKRRYLAAIGSPALVQGRVARWQAVNADGLPAWSFGTSLSADPGSWGGTAETAVDRLISGGSR